MQPDGDDDLTEALAKIRASEAERQEAYAQFRTTLADLAPMEKASVWLSYIAEHREKPTAIWSRSFFWRAGVAMLPIPRGS